MKTSRGEIKIAEILDDHDVFFRKEYSFENLKSENGKLLRFDFAVFDDDQQLDFLIEYQGRQHYEPVSKFGGKVGLYRQQHNDNQKRRFCKLRNIPLVEIPYTDYEDISFDYIMHKAGY